MTKATIFFATAWQFQLRKLKKIIIVNNVFDLLTQKSKKHSKINLVFINKSNKLLFVLGRIKMKAIYIIIAGVNANSYHNLPRKLTIIMSIFGAIFSVLQLPLFG